MTPDGLDQRLARGWFRSGPLLYRTPVFPLDGVLRELVHIRLRVQAVPRSKSLRRVLRRGRERFRCVVRRARLTAEHERLYRATRGRFIGFVMRDLDGMALCESDSPFDTREVSVFDGDRLVAVSYFDVGRRAVASLLGLHDPAYASFGLGTYTALEEMAFAAAHGAQWHYPGYVVPDLPMFDYKLRLGSVQFLRPDGRWRALAAQPLGTPLVDHATARFAALEAALTARGVPHRRRIYPCVWLGWLDGTEVPFLRGMWHLALQDAGPGVLVVEHLVAQDKFVLARARAVVGLDPFERVLPHPELAALCDLRALKYSSRIAVERSVEAIADAAAAAVVEAGTR
ncbi:MAG: arginyl-tRNA--protein-N-Asp/Glu arginylyltransferase [Myxococcota bacterium]|jgi:arginyl-tRNA--protein-N-Asp/Glu arginylyltransferase